MGRAKDLVLEVVELGDHDHPNTADSHMDNMA